MDPTLDVFRVGITLRPQGCEHLRPLTPQSRKEEAFSVSSTPSPISQKETRHSSRRDCRTTFLPFHLFIHNLDPLCLGPLRSPFSFRAFASTESRRCCFEKYADSFHEDFDEILMLTASTSRFFFRLFDRTFTFLD